MFKKGRKTEESQGGSNPSEKGSLGSWIKTNKVPIIAVGLIAVMAFVMRFVFSVGVSADNAYEIPGGVFALSGGTVASEHLHTITQILNGGSFFGSDGSLNYPFGSVNSNPILIDVILAGIAMIGTSLGMLAIKAASLTLATFSLVCGTMAVIPAFFLGKEILGTKKAGYVAAIFVAFCPVVITQTVFSNGTETGWILLLFTILALLIFKGIKAIEISTRFDDPLKAVIAANRFSVKMAIFAGLILALIALSTNDFRPIVELLIVAMAIMVVIGRFTYRDTRAVAVFFSIIIAIGMLVATAYYIPAQLWDQVLSGILIASAISIAVCLSFSMLQKKPWVITIPVYAIVLIAGFATLALLMPSLFDVIVKGNSIYADSVASLISNSLSVSHISANYGVVTMWFSILVVGILIWRLTKDITSYRRQFEIVFLAGSIYLASKSDVFGTIFAPAYAICFAYIIMWIFDHVDFKSYFLAIKNAEFKTSWKKVLKPVPFLTIIVVAVLICMPIAVYALDASISTNENDKYDGLDTGAVGYYVKTSSDWVSGPAMSSYYFVEDKSGALVTWIDYSDDAATFGKFDVIADAEGNGAEAVSNILLSNAVDGSSTASMLIYLLKYNGFSDAVKTALGMSDDDYNTLKGIIENPGQYRSTVLNDVSKYGILKSDVSDENIMYIYGANFLSDNYDAFTISEMYSKIVELSGKNISYFMVDGTMFPMYYGYSSVFSTMGYVNGYATTDDYGTVGQFLTASYYTYYTGIYDYTDAMYDTLLWRAYIGKSPAEAGISSSMGAGYLYFEKLMLSDGTYKATPGYGLSNYQVDYGHWYVMYNVDSEATLNSDGWTKMLYNDAIKAQESNGGLINYLSGLPVFLKYVPNSSGTAVSGIVSTAGNGIENIRVSVVDSAGVVHSTAFTDSDGRYNVLVPNSGCSIKFYAGSQNLADGTLIKTLGSTGGNVEVELGAVEAVFVDSEGDDYDVTSLSPVLTMKGKVSGEEYTPVVGTDGFTVTVVPDTYTVTLKSADGKTVYVSDKTISVGPGTNSGIKIALDMQDVTLSFTNDAGAAMSGVKVRLKELSTGTIIPDTMIDPYESDKDGKIQTTLVNGTYVYEFVDNYVTATTPLTVSSSATAKTVKVLTATSVTFTGFPGNKLVSVYSTGYQTTAISAAGGNVTVKLPAGLGDTVVYTAYAVDGDTGYVANTNSLAAVSGTMKITGTLKNSSGDATSGKILFIKGDYQIPVSVSSDGSYSVILPETGSYVIYANNGSDVKMFTKDITSADTIDIEMVSGTKVSGYTYWYNTNYVLPLVPIAVSDIQGCDGCSFTIVTDAAGAYSFYIPEDSKCVLTAKLSSTGNYNFDTDVYTKTETDVSGSKSFTAKVINKINVTNNYTGHSIKIGSTTILSGENADIAVTGTSWTITIEDDMYRTCTMAVWPGMGNQIVNATTFGEATTYYAYTGTISATDSVTVTALDDEAGSKFNRTSGTTLKYYLEKDKSFQFTIKNADSNKIMYYNSGVVTSATVVPVTLLDAATVKGYVGLNDTGKLAVTYDANTYEFSISSGNYSVMVPIDRAVDLKPTIVKESSDVTYTYTADARTIAASTLVAGSTATYNFAVTSSTGAGTGDITSNMTVNSMTDDATATVEFTTVYTYTAESSSITYTLAGGSAWIDVTFYSDSARTAEISSITFTNPTTTTVYGKGTILRNSVAYAADNLTVILTDINGKEACTSKVTAGDANWSKTTPSASTTKVDIGVNSVINSEYEYGVKLVNNDNFTKKFTISAPAEVDTANWFITYVNDKDINTTGAFEIKGYTTVTVYVKISNKLTGDVTPEIPKTITFNVTVTDVSGSINYDVSTDDEAITVSGNVANVKATATSSSVTVDTSGATGRDVLNSKSDMPTYVWILIALAVALMFLIIWMASKRGVFTRKK